MQAGSWCPDSGVVMSLSTAARGWSAVVHANHYRQEIEAALASWKQAIDSP
jgi:hypothetical protein